MAGLTGSPRTTNSPPSMRGFSPSPTHGLRRLAARPRKGGTAAMQAAFEVTVPAPRSIPYTPFHARFSRKLPLFITPLGRGGGARPGHLYQFCLSTPARHVTALWATPRPASPAAAFRAFRGQRIPASISSTRPPIVCDVTTPAPVFSDSPGILYFADSTHCTTGMKPCRYSS
jgi:hypothetical protein